MRWIISLIMAAWLAAGFGTAHAQGAANTRLQTIEAPAPSLEGNLLGTPTTQSVLVYLPPSYTRARARRYPVIYMLHGFTGHPGDLFDAARLDRMIAAHEIREVIVVMPSGRNVFGGPFYRNSPVSGNWADFIARDLVAFIDARYRTLARPGGRAIVGFSMGGYGALYLAMERPGIYSVAYAQSPCCTAPIEELSYSGEAWNRILAAKSIADVEAAGANGDFNLVGGTAILQAFAPAPDAPPLFIDFPVRVADGARYPNGAAYDRYVARYPLARATETRDALNGLRAFGFDAGLSDQNAHIPAGARALSARLSELRVPHHFELFDGDHMNRTGERMHRIAIPFAAAALDPPE